MNIKFIGLLLLLSFAIIIPGKSQTPEPDKIERNIFIKKISGYNIVYDCYNRRQTSTDKIIIYAKNPKAKTKLLTYEFGDNYILDVTIKYFLNHPFIYVTSGHTHGHFLGVLYALDLTHFKTRQIIQLPGHLKDKMPDNLELRNYNGIRIGKNNKIMDGGYYRDHNYVNYTIDYELKIVKIGYNKYGLEPIKQIVTNDGEL